MFENFALEVAPGSVVALLGPSGIGKSTLLRLIAGIDRDWTGTIRLNDADAQAAPQAGFVFQDARLLPWLTALGNVRLAVPQLSPEQAMAGLAQVGLEAHAHAFPRQLSGGMQRRVALARALAGRTALLLLDEPFVSLDRELVRDMHGLVGDAIGRTQATVILATHQAEDAARLADRVLVLAGGPVGIKAELDFPLPPAARDDTVLAAYQEQLQALP